ncbi:Mitochondrial GTPase 1 [Malassezia vespertilionis]|uniref:Mitochondrial GTPase 1 n=1 Tax=Malassezia vespertilionis TaxID=2020962 RepID=UPI0024B2120A|nr:Mitochondrial GTPase 1 [Malassezia vespertilionis]WFD04872.1 Mitochondrial GTPase 1 [Malassezia vespertilionis]
MPRIAPGARVAAKAAEQALAPSPATAFSPRTSFAYPATVPSWYIGHMHRAMRSIPSLLARTPPPLVVEVRDARLPLTSINPVFESLLQSAPSAQERVRISPGKRVPGWAARRLVVYAKRDLIDPHIAKPFCDALETYGHGQHAMFVDTRMKKDVERVYKWVCERAALLGHAAARAASRVGQLYRRSRLSGAARYTPTPETGVRLLVVGMPNVGKSSLLNALRHVGTGKGSAASTHPHPGHTRKVTGTVRITPAPPSLSEYERSGAPVDMKALVEQQAKQAPAVYVYDTPGIMVPHLGNSEDGGPERALKLAIAGCMKQSLFDPQTLADYLLFRMNQRYMYAAREHATRQWPPYAALLRPPYLTDTLNDFLSSVAERAPGARQKGGDVNLRLAAEYVIEQFRRGQLGDRELDLELDEGDLRVPRTEKVHARVRTFMEQQESMTEKCGA